MLELTIAEFMALSRLMGAYVTASKITAREDAERDALASLVARGLAKSADGVSFEITGPGIACHTGRDYRITRTQRQGRRVA